MKKHSAPLPLPPAPVAEQEPHVYVVNSDSDFLEMIAELLADKRVRVTLEQMRPNVAITLENLRLAQPNLLLLDVVPFRSDAELLLESMETEETLRGVPVLLASTTTGFAEQVASRHGVLVRDIMPKPFDIDLFYNLLSRLLHEPI